MFGGFGLPELLVILVIVLLIFGPKRLKTIGSDIGNAIKGFRKAVTDEDKAKTAEESKVIDAELNEAHKTESNQDTHV